MSNNRQESETKMVVSVSEMARMVGLSRQRFHQLMPAGVFPQPQRNDARPFYDEPTQQQCLEVRRRNCGVNGKVVSFDAQRQATPIKPREGVARSIATRRLAGRVEGARAGVADGGRRGSGSQNFIPARHHRHRRR
jgi:hypothetical protein